MNQWPQQTDAFSSRPLIAFEGARALYLGPALGLKPHRNAAFTLAVGLDAPIRLTLYLDRSASSFTTEGPIVCVPAGSLHRLEAAGMMAFLNLEAVGDDADHIGVSNLLPAHQILVAERLDALRAWGLERWRTVLGVPATSGIDPRTAAVAPTMVKDPDAYPFLSEAAHAAALSPTRFNAVYRQQLDAPFRCYRLWRRMGLTVPPTRSWIEQLAPQSRKFGLVSLATPGHWQRKTCGLSFAAPIAMDWRQNTGI